MGNNSENIKQTATNNSWNTVEKYYILTSRRTIWLTGLIVLLQLILLLPILLIQNEISNKVFYLCHSIITNLLLIFIIYLINHRKIMFIAIYQINSKDNTFISNNWRYYIFAFLLAIIFFILTSASYAIVKHINYLEALKSTWWLSLLTLLWVFIFMSLNHEICKYLIKENLGENA